jgi:hypothetical protein
MHVKLRVGDMEGYMRWKRSISARLQQRWGNNASRESERIVRASNPSMYILHHACGVAYWRCGGGVQEVAAQHDVS